MPTLVEVVADGERLAVYPLGEGLGVLAKPPLFARGYRYGDLVQTQYENGSLKVRRIVRAGTAPSWRFQHALTATQVQDLVQRCGWLGAVARATARELVVAVPINISAYPVLEAIRDCGIDDAAAELADQVVA